MFQKQSLRSAFDDTMGKYPVLSFRLRVTKGPASYATL